MASREVIAAKATPELCAKVMAWRRAKLELGGRKQLCHRLDISPSMLDYIVKRGGKLKGRGRA